MDRRSFVTLGLLAGLAPAALRAGEGRLRMRDLYEKDASFTALARDLAGESVEVEGYMAPPLKANSTFFVLTKRPMSVCPFCETEAEWPEDILAVYTRRVYDVVAFNRKIVVRGELALGSHTDPETGFLSRVRIENARVGYA
jgi:hypothetical protein